MEYKIIDLVFPILVHFLALQLTGILGIGDAAFQTMLAAVITMPLFFWLYRKDQNLWKKRKKKNKLDPVDHRDRGGGRAEYPVFGTDVVSGIGLWDYQ